MRLVTGLQAVREAIRVHGAGLDQVLVEKDGGPQIEAVARFAQDRGAKVARVTRSEIDKASKGARHQGAIAFAPELAIVSIDEIVATLKDDTVIVALDEIEDPQNFGAVIRSSVALGATAVLWPENHSAPLSPATFRASAGAVEHARLCRVAALPTALETLKAAAVHVVGLDMNADKVLADVEINGPCVLVVGAEGKGLRKPVKKACTALANLPMTGAIDSLNASVAAAIALYELRRRK